MLFIKTEVIFLKKFLIAGFLVRYFKRNWRAMTKTTMVTPMTSKCLKNLAEAKGRRPEPMITVATSKITTQKTVVLTLASKNFLKLTF